MTPISISSSDKCVVKGTGREDVLTSLAHTGGGKGWVGDVAKFAYCQTTMAGNISFESNGCLQQTPAAS